MTRTARRRESNADKDVPFLTGARIGLVWLMRNAILRHDEGYDLQVDGVDRTFRDLKEHAYAAARNLKRTNRDCVIEIRDRSTGKNLVMGEDGRTM